MTDRAYDALSRGFAALTGAGLSTDSGIPDYRGPSAPARTPMMIDEFLSDHRARQRYWARSHVGWDRMHRAQPNGGHHALVALEKSGRLTTLITQNVDGLHDAAGSRRVIPLHGSIADVICLVCGRRSPRAELQAELDELNPGWRERHAHTELRPDGDADLEDTSDFVVPACQCGGIVKPDVVFFGEQVPRDRVAAGYQVVQQSPALLVAGSSLTVMSGLRFVRAAVKWRKPVVILNRGLTRGDQFASVLVEAGTTEWLTQYAAATT